jgi:hypothetical protein
LTDATTSQDPYLQEAYTFAKANWHGYALTWHKVYLHLMTLRKSGQLPKAPLTHVLAAAKSGTSIVDAENTDVGNPSIAGIVIGNTGNLIHHPKDQITKAVSPLVPDGLKEVGKLAGNITELMTGKYHVLLRTTYIVFGAIALLAGVALLARELGMKQIQKVAQAPLNTAKTTAKKTAKATKDGYSGN